MTFRARYRSRNINGWSGYSPIGYILAAVVPEPPEAPTFIDATNTTITLSLWPTLDNGGSQILQYELYRDDGNMGAFIKVTNYIASQTYTLDSAIDSTLIAGKIYRFYTLALNAKGYSDPSSIVSASMVNLPDKANTPTKIMSLSTSNTLAFSWVGNQDSELPGGAITGYKIWMDNGMNGDFV